MKNLLSLAFATVLVVSLSACGGSTPPPTPAPSPSESTAVDSSEGTLQDPSPAGTEIEVTTVAEAHYAVSFGKADFEATDVVTSNLTNPTPDPGFQYLIVPATYENLGETIISVGLETALVLFVDTQGAPYSGAVVAVEGSAFDAPPLEPGDSVTVSLVYTVPIGTTSGLWTIGGEFYVYAS